MRYLLFLFVLLFSGVLVPVLALNEYIIHRNYYPPRGEIIYGTLSNDGRYVFAIDKQHSIRVWVYHSGRTLKTLRSGEHKAVIAVMHPAKSLLFTGGKDGSINIWDLKKGTLFKTLTQHSTPITALSISSNGEFLISGAQDSQVLLWKLDRYNVIEKISDPAKKITAVTFHPSSRKFAWANRTRQIKIWDIQKRKVVASQKKHLGEVTGLQFNPKNNLIASASADRTIILWDWKNKKIIKVLTGHTRGVTGISYHPSGNKLLSCAADNQIYIWNTSSFKITSKLSPSEKPLIGCTFSQGGRQVLGTYIKNYLRTWSIGNKGKWADLSGHKRAIQSLDISPSGDRLISASTDMSIKLWDIKPGVKKMIRSYPFNGFKVEQIRFSPDNIHFATANTNSQILVWDSRKKTDEAELFYTLKGHNGKINTIAFHPTKNFLISAGADKKVILWDLGQKKNIYESEVHSGQIESIRFSRKGDRYATSSKDRTIKVWDTQSHRLLFTFRGHKRGVRDIAFSSNDTLLASASDDKTIGLWNLLNGKLIKKFPAHDFVISALHFSPDGSTLISASRDKTIRLWNIKDGSFIKTLSGENEQITSVATHPKRRLLAVGTLGPNINMLILPRKYFKPLSKRKSRLPEDGKVDMTSDGSNDESVAVTDEQDSVLLNESKNATTSKDTQTEEVSEAKDKIFDPVVESVDHQLLSSQSRLNLLMKENNICENSSEIETISFSILKKLPSDQAAYYALMKTFIVNKDLQMIYLMAKIGQYASFFTEKYDFIPQSEAADFFNSWMKTVFNQAIMRGDSNVNLEFTDCHGAISTLNMPNYLLFIDLPEETVQRIINNKVAVDFSAFTRTGGTPELFRDKVFALIDAVEKDDRMITELTLRDYMPGISGWNYGYITVNLSNIQQWGLSSERVKYQIKRERHGWMTFYTDTNKQKTVLLRQGNYYVKVNNKVRKAFILSQNNQKIEIKPE